MPDINPIIQQADMLNAQVNSAKFALADLSSKQQANDTQTAALQIDLGQQQAVVDSAQMTGVLHAQQDVNNFGLMIGGGAGDPTGTLKALADNYNQAEKDKADQLAIINQKKSIDPLSDFVGWVQAQFTINTDIARYNAANATAQDAKDHINSINQMISARGVADKAMESTVTTASIEAQSKKTADLAQIEANKASNAALIANATNIQNQVGLSQTQLELQSKVLAAQDQQITIGIAQEQLKLAQAREAEYVQDKEDKRASYEDMAAKVQAGFRQLNPNAPEANGAFGPAQVAAMKGGKDKLDPMMAEAYRIGVLNSYANPTGQTRLLATSPADMLGVLQYNPEMSPAQSVMKNILIQAKDDLNSGKADPQTTAAWQAAQNAKDKDQQIKIYNEYANAKLAQEAKRVDGPSNPFYLSPINKIVDSTPGLQGLDFNQKVIQPGLKAGIDYSDPTVVMNSAISAMKDGTIKINQAAADIATIYAQGARLNVMSKSMVGMGFAPPHSYNVSINTGLGTSLIVDMTKPQDVLNALVKVMSAKTSLESMAEFSSQIGQ